MQEWRGRILSSIVRIVVVKDEVLWEFGVLVYELFCAGTPTFCLLAGSGGLNLNYR